MELLYTAATAVATVRELIALSLVVLSVVHCLRVGQAASIRVCHIEHRQKAAIYDDNVAKVANYFVALKLGAWGEEWRKALLQTD